MESLNNVNFRERCNMKRNTVLIGITLVVATVFAGTLVAQAQESLFGTCDVPPS
jgi:hypothetical protein